MTTRDVRTRRAEGGEKGRGVRGRKRSKEGGESDRDGGGSRGRSRRSKEEEADRGGGRKEGGGVSRRALLIQNEGPAPRDGWDNILDPPRIPDQGAPQGQVRRTSPAPPTARHIRASGPRGLERISHRAEKKQAQGRQKTARDEKLSGKGSGP